MARGERLPFLPLNLRPGFSQRCHAVLDDDDELLVGTVTFGAAPFADPPGDAPRSKQDDGEPCIGSDEDQYSNSDGWSACWRVLLHNPPKGPQERRKRVYKLRELSLLGPNGHVERMNAWTHLVGAVGFLVFAFLRPLILDSTSISGQLAGYSSIVLVFTFLVSTAFHTGGTVRRLAPILRTFDHGAIDVALAVACTADAAIVTLDFKDVPWQTVMDSSGVAVVILAFFLYRRLVLPPEDTEVKWGDCRLGLFRFQHADFEYGAFRSAGYICLSFGFISLIPAAFTNLSTRSAMVLVLCNGISLVLLIAGMGIDNVLVWPDVLYQSSAEKPNCHSRSCGCIMTSHAWWHVFSLVSVVVLTVGREVAIANTDFPVREEL